MGVFKDDNEAYQFLGGIFEKAMESADISAKMAESGVILRLRYTDPDATITVDMHNKKVLTGDTSLTPTVEMFMSADTGNKFWLGKVNLAAALASGTVRARGPAPKILKLIPVTKQLFPHYADLLRAAGRTDLVNA